MDTMPGVPIAVSLSDILEVRGGPLREREVWALLCQSAAAIQDFFIKGASSKKDDTFFVISPMTLTVCRDGQVNLTPGESTWHGNDFKAPECCSDTAHMLSDTATEKMFLYTLGKTLQVATEYGLCKNEYVSVSHHLDSLLEAMCEENPAVRIGLRSILEACDLHTRQHPEKTPYAQTICHLYSSVLGSTACQTGMDSSDNNQQRTVRSRRRPRHPHHHHHDRHSSPTGSPPPAHSRSRSRSRSRSQGTLDPEDGNCTLVKPSEKESEKSHSGSCVGNTTSSPAFTTSAGTLTTLTTTSSCTIPLTSSQDLNVSFASSLGDQSSLYHPAPAYQAYPAMPGLLSLHMENPAYGKYLQLKERQHRLKAAKIGKEAELKGVSCEGLSTPHSVPLPFGTWQGDMMDYMTDARSLASLMSYTVGSCMPELTSLDTHSAAPVIHGDGGSALSSNLSLLMQDDHQAHVSLPEEPKESPLEVSSCLKRRREDDIPEEQQKRPAALEMSKSNQKMDRSPLPSQQQGHTEHLGKPSDQFPELSRPSQQPAWKEQSVQHPHVEAQQQPHPLQQLHQFGSRDLTPTPDALPAKEYYGPEFVYRASHPVIRISLPLQGESVKNPALARRVIIVHLTGQKFEALVDPCMTGRQLFDAVVTNTALDDFFFFGLTYICDGEHFFLDADTKLHKMSPEGWREGAKGHMPPVTFTLYLRVKFYPDSLTDFRHMSSQHLLYLQLRRDILEERCMADDQQLLSLSGLALHAEFGDYSRRTMGHNYFVPEQYLPARVARRLGMGYVHDRALEAHRDALGLAPSQCEIQFIKLVQKLPEYGIHFYKLMKAKNDSSNLVWVGITQTSLLIADQSGSQRSVTQALPWPAILKISFNKRRFSVQPKVDRAAHTKGKLPKISFFTNSYRKGKYLLQLSTAQHRFCIRMRSRAAALENLGGHGELEDGQYDVFSLGSQEALVEGERQGEDAKEQEDEKDEEGQQMFSQEMVASVESCSGPVETASVDSPAKQVSSPGTDSSSSVGQEEDRPEVPPLKYRSPPPYHLNLDCLMEELSANSSVHAQDRMPTTAASSDMHASVNLAMEPGTEQTALQSDAASPLANHISSPQLSEPYAADSSPHHHHQPPYSHRDSDHVPDSHLAPGQPSLGRQVLEVTLQKEGDKGIGITIVGGEATGSLDLGIFVKSVMKDGPAARTNQIKAGDRLIAINGISLEGVQHHEAVQLIRDSVGSVRLLLSQMQPPLTIKRKLKGTKTRSDTDDVDAACLADDKDLDINHISADHPNITPSTNDTTVSHSHHSHHLSVPHGYHLGPDSTDFMKSGSMKPVSNFQSGYLAASELDNGNVDSDAGDGVLLEEEMLAAAELDLQNYEAGDISQTLDAEAEFDKETQELQILGDIANMTVDNSDTDSDFESAIQATVEGKVRRSSSKKTCDTGSSFRKSMSVTSPDSVIYEVVLEKEKGSLGIMISEGEQYNRLYVQSLVPGGPAQSGGILQPGDCLLELNGQSLKGVTRKDLEKTMQTAADVCLLKIARTKSLDALSQGHGAEQSSKGDGSMQQGATTAVSGETSFEEMVGLDSQISPPSAFASAAPTPSRDASSIPIVPPPPPLTFDTLHVEDERSNNTQSDIDSDVLDSSRSELEQIYRSAEKYLDSDVEDIELDAVAGVANLHMDADDSVDGAGSHRNRHSGSNQQGDRGDISDDISAASETVKNTSPPTVRSVGAALHLSGKSQSKSLLRQDRVIETTERESDSAADEQASDKNQVEEFIVNLVKSPGGGLGFTVVGGVNTTGGCYIKAVVQDPALSDGRLHAGDRLIQVNGQDMTGLSHFEAVTFLRQTPKEVSIKVWRYYHATQPSFPPPHNTGKSGLPDKIQHVTGVGKQRESYAQKSRHVEPDENSSERVWDQQQASAETTEGQQTPVKNQARCLDTPRAIIRPYTYGQQNDATQGRAKPSTTEPSQDNSETNTDVVQIALDKPQPRESLGFSLVQRPMDCGQTGIFIKTLSPGGIAHTDGQLRVGDRLLQVNGEPLIGCSHTKAVRLLRETVGTVVLTISRFPEDQFESNATEDGAVPSGEIGRLTNEDGRTTPSSSLCSSNDLSDDDINDILDEAINFLDRQDGDDSRTVEAVSGDQGLPASSGQGERRTPGQGEPTVPMSSVQTASHSLSSVVVPGDRVLSGPLPPVKGEDSGTSNHLSGDQDVTEMQCTSFVRQISSVEIPEDLTTRSLLSLPVLRITKEVEERRVQLLQCLADALEQEEPLLEFEKLRQMKATDNMEVAKLAENKSRNRYRNVLPYDYNRVELQTTSPEENNYINASDVQLSVKGKAEPMHYIACQGPLMATQGHFWQMVWEAGTNVVAMLTQEMELGKVKCHRYWPESPGQSLDLCEGRYSVHLVKEDRLEDFDVRRLRMTDHCCGEEREVVHLHYIAWPDHGVPDSAYPMLLFVRLMHQLHQSGPFVVHCSAGIGRSGVLMAVDTALARIETGDELDLFDIVSELRQQRYGMIQTQDQYLFCYTACMEALLSTER